MIFLNRRNRCMGFSCFTLGKAYNWQLSPQTTVSKGSAGVFLKRRVRLATAISPTPFHEQWLRPADHLVAVSNGPFWPLLTFLIILGRYHLTAPLNRRPMLLVFTRTKPSLWLVSLQKSTLYNRGCPLMPVLCEVLNLSVHYVTIPITKMH